MAVTNVDSNLMVRSLNKSVQEIYRTISGNKIKVKEIEKKTTYSPRTVRHALRTLLDLDLIMQIPDLADLRSHYYQTTMHMRT